ncbi:hypothetical protein D3C80_1003490 [compost metagenome]
MKVAVHQPGTEGLRPALVQPGADGVNIRQAVRAGPARKLVVAFQLLHPAARLAFEKAFGLAEVAEPDRFVVDERDAREALDHGQAHGATCRGGLRMEGRHADGGVEPVQRLHQIEGGAEHRGVRAVGDQACVGHV